MLDSVTGENVEKALSHERKEEVRTFYADVVYRRNVARLEKPYSENAVHQELKRGLGDTV